MIRREKKTALASLPEKVRLLILTRTLTLALTLALPLALALTLTPFTPTPVCQVAPLDCSLEAAALQKVGLLKDTPPRKGGSFAQLRCALRKHKPHILWSAGQPEP